MATDEGNGWNVGRELGAAGVHCEVADLPVGVDAVTARRACLVVVLVSSALSAAERAAAVAREVGAMPSLEGVA